MKKTQGWHADTLLHHPLLFRSMGLVMPGALDPDFFKCFPLTLAQEDPDPTNWSDPKNFSDDPRDPGGATMDGVIQSEYNIYLKSQGLPITSVRNITEPQGQDIYYHSYWLPHCPSLAPGVNLCIYDSDVNMGPTEATKIFQYISGVTVDGIWGPQTAAAVADIKSVAGVINNFTARREAVYREMSDFKYFGTDWIRRAQQIGQQALAMV
jgi:lysozyme family protein